MSECLVINSRTNICIFPQQLGLESRPAEVGGIAYVSKRLSFLSETFFFVRVGGFALVLNIENSKERTRGRKKTYFALLQNNSAHSQKVFGLFVSRSYAFY